MTIEIRHRYTKVVLLSHEGPTIAHALKAAVAAKADLADANLSGANLADANLADANLAGANLADANLARAYLARAYLADANLAGANLSGADLARAYLADANLADANLSGANLAGADLADANLADANLSGADLADANLADARNVPPGITATQASDLTPAVPREPFRRKTAAERAADYRARHPEVPVVDHLDRRILEAISVPGNHLEMTSWHTCETTHCRAGWAIHLAGKAGYDLEKRLGDPAVAGRAIYLASTGRTAHFFATNDRALADIKRRAEMDGASPL